MSRYANIRMRLYPTKYYISEVIMKVNLNW